MAEGTVHAPEAGLNLGRRHLLRVDDGPGALQLVPGYGGAALVAIELNTV